jgi:hypothetical protein
VVGIQCATLFLATLSSKNRSRKKPCKSKDRAKAEKLVKTMDITLTGARPSDTLEGSAKATQGALFVLLDTSAPIPPYKKHLDLVRTFPDLWAQLLERLQAIEFFRQLFRQGGNNNAAIVDWLRDQAAPGEFHLSDLGRKLRRDDGEVRLQMLELGKSTLVDDLPEEAVDQIMASEMTATEIKELIPRKEGQSAETERHTLIFLLSRWKLVVTFRVEMDVTAWSGKYLDVDRAILTEEKIHPMKATTHDLFIIPWSAGKSSRDLGILVAKSVEVFSRANVLDEVRSFFPGHKAVLDRVFLLYQELDRLRPAFWKSLIQKLIRFRPDHVRIFGERFPADVCLVGAVAFLLLNPGSLVPDIKRFVTGQEGCIKRLAVIAFEDSFTDDSIVDGVFRLGVWSFLSQRVRSWRPSRAYLHEIFQLGLALWRERRFYEYDTENDLKPYSLWTGRPSKLQVVSALMDEVKSFAGDLAMIRDIAGQPKRLGTVHRPEGKGETETEMPIIHCVDQHWAPDVAYFYALPTINTALVEQKTRSSATPFAALFAKLFKEVTGINTRKHSATVQATKEHSDFWLETRNAQQLFWTARLLHFHAVTKRPHAMAGLAFDYEIPRGYLAGMIGSLQLKVSETETETETETKIEKKSKAPKKKKKKPRSKQMTVNVTVLPDEIEELRAIATVSRDKKKKTELTNEEHVDAVQAGYALLEKGVKLNACSPPVEGWVGAQARWDAKKGEHMVKLKEKKTTISWDTLRFLHLTFHKTKPLKDLELETCLVRQANQTLSTGLVENANTLWRQLLHETRPDDLQAALAMMAGFPQVIVFPHLSRAGGGSEQSVVASILGAYQFTLKFSTIMPAAIKRRELKPLEFEVRSGPLLWYMREQIQERADEAGRTETETQTHTVWNPQSFSEIVVLPLWPHQTDALNQMIARDQAGKRRQFVYMTVGSGKTALVLHFLRYLFLESGPTRFFPDYVIYALPSTAIDTIANEMKRFRVRHRVLNPTKNKVVEMEPGMLFLIEHDHLRHASVRPLLLEHISRSFLIVDEVHLAMESKTQRTGICLQLARLAHRVVAMTGTAVIDAKIYRLQRWFDLLADFPVTRANFFVEANEMLAMKVDTGIRVMKEEVVVEWAKEGKRVEYLSLVSTRIGGTRPAPTAKDFATALELCYKEVSVRMVADTLHLVARNQGVMLVAKDARHATTLRDALVHSGQIDPAKIFLFTKKVSLNLTDDSVTAGTVPDYKIVIVPIKKASGYSLTRLKVFISSVYPSNQATRTQIEGRLNRLGQHAKSLVYRTYHIGLLTYILRNHEHAANFEAVLSSLASEHSKYPSSSS